MTSCRREFEKFGLGQKCVHSMTDWQVWVLRGAGFGGIVLLSITSRQGAVSLGSYSHQDGLFLRHCEFIASETCPLVLNVVCNFRSSDRTYKDMHTMEFFIQKVKGN